MWKKGLAVMLAAGLAAMSLSGCGDAVANGGKEKVRLMVWSPSEDQSKDSGEWLQTNCEAFAEEHPQWDITFVYGVADEASAAGQVAQDPEASADVFMFANDTLTTLTDADGLTKFGGKYREEIESENSQQVLTECRLPQTPGSCIMTRVYFQKKMSRVLTQCWRKEWCPSPSQTPGIFRRFTSETDVPCSAMEPMSRKEWISADKKQWT